MHSFLATVLTVALGFQHVAAQTYTSCNPMNRTDCPADTALGKTIQLDFTTDSYDEYFEVTGLGNGNVGYGTSEGLAITMNGKGDAPTLNSKFYIFFGKVEMVLKGSPGSGIISSFVLESDDLDEVDLEWFGTDISQTESNYFGKDNTTAYDRAVYHDMANPIADYHTYAVDWTSERIIWSIDGAEVRTLNYADALNGENYPQTPMMIKIGIWAGGDSDNGEGTIEWAGGLTDYSEAPFTMYLKSLYVQDYSYGKEYIYTDKSGSWQSIKVSNSTSVITTSQRKTMNSSSSISSVGVASGLLNNSAVFNSSNGTTVASGNSSATAPFATGLAGVSNQVTMSGLLLALAVSVGSNLL